MAEPKPIQIQFLELLENAGVAKSAAIGHFIADNFEKIDYNLFKYEGKKEDAAYRFITNLETKKYVYFDWNWYEELYLLDPIKQDYSWFDDVNAHASITIEGLDYLNNWRLIESNFKVNEAAILSSSSQVAATKVAEKNYTLQLAISVVTIILALATTVLSALTFVESKSNGEKLDRLQIQISQSREEQLKLNTEQNIKLDALAKHLEMFRTSRPSSSNNEQTTYPKELSETKKPPVKGGSTNR